MARSKRQSSGSSRASSGGARSSRSSTRSTSRKSRVAEAEEASQDDGLGLTEGIVFATTIILVAAFVMLDMARGKYGEALFF